MTFREASTRSRASDGPPAALYDRIRASIEATPASTIGTRTRVVLALAAALLAVASVLLIASDVVYQRHAVGLEVGTQSIPHLLFVLFAVVGLTLISTLVALTRGRSGLGPDVTWLALVAGLVTPIYALLVLENPVHAHDSAVLAVDISPWGLRCAIIATIVGTFVLASFAIALSRAIPAAHGLRGAAVGAAAGAWAGLTVFMFCPSSDIQHLLVGHVLPIVAFTLLGSVVLPRVLRA